MVKMFHVKYFSRITTDGIIGESQSWSILDLSYFGNAIGYRLPYLNVISSATISITLCIKYI